MTLRSPACRGTDPEMWFSADPTDVEAAREICTRCPIRQFCLDRALERREPWGVWGGELLDAGRITTGLKRPRQLSHKNPQVAELDQVVTRLVAEGLTAAQIAQRLHLHVVEARALVKRVRAQLRRRAESSHPSLGKAA